LCVVIDIVLYGAAELVRGALQVSVMMMMMMMMMISGSWWKLELGLPTAGS